MAAGDQRARATFKSSRPNEYFPPLTEKERWLPRKARWERLNAAYLLPGTFIYEGMHNSACLPCYYWWTNTIKMMKGKNMLSFTQKPVTQIECMQVRVNAHAEQDKSSSPSGEPSDDYSQGWPGCSGNHGCSSPRSRPVGSERSIE